MITFLVALVIILGLLGAYYFGQYRQLLSQWEHDTDFYDEERERLITANASLEAQNKELLDRLLARNGYKPVLEKNQPPAPSQADIEGLQGVFAKTRERIRTHRDAMSEEERAALKEENG